MGYFLTSEAENAVPGKSAVAPKTHTPLPQLEKRGHRYYNPGLGRWVSRDPVGEMGFNLLANNSPKTILDKDSPLQKAASSRHGVPEQSVYVFLQNAPTDRIDPVGLRDTDCNNVCAMVIRLGLYMEGWGGVVICYRGTLCPCVNYPAYPPGTDPGIFECIKLHEETHIKHDEFSCGTCDWYHAAGSPGKDPAGDECRAYVAQLECLISQKLKRCLPGDYVCTGEYDYWITFVRNQADVNCNYSRRK